jgi:hypothetical protein
MRASMNETRVNAPTRAHIARRKRSGHRARISHEIKCKVRNTRRQAHARVQLIDTLLSCCSVPDAAHHVECCVASCTTPVHISPHCDCSSQVVSFAIPRTVGSLAMQCFTLELALLFLVCHRVGVIAAHASAGGWLAKSLTRDKSRDVGSTAHNWWCESS